MSTAGMGAGRARPCALRWYFDTWRLGDCCPLCGKGKAGSEHLLVSANHHRLRPCVESSSGVEGPSSTVSPTTLAECATDSSCSSETNTEHGHSTSKIDVKIQKLLRKLKTRNRGIHVIFERSTANCFPFAPRDVQIVDDRLWSRLCEATGLRSFPTQAGRRLKV